MKKYKFSFSYGTIQKLTFDYYDIVLYSAANKVLYKATIGRLDAAQYMNDYNALTIIK